MMVTQNPSTASMRRFPHTFGVVEERSTKQDAWVRFVDEFICAFSYQTDRSGAFSVQARARSLAGFTVARLITTAGPAQLSRRSTEINRDAKASYAFYVPTRGYQDIHQFNRSEKVSTGTLTVVSTCEPFLQVKPGDNDTICLLVGSDFVDQRALHIEDRCARVVAAEHGLPSLFCDSLIALEREAPMMSEQQFLSAIHTVSELAILAVTSSPATRGNFCTSIAANHLAKAKRIIRRRIADPMLTLADIARECSLSLRYLHKLFGHEGRSMNAYLMTKRLEYARDLLQHASASATVTDVCFSSGFSNASQFSTAFRRAFGVSPRDVLRGNISERAAAGVE
jgi:AraC-like DNA-binding protein